MPAMPKSSRSSRTLVSPNLSHDASVSPLKPTSNGYHEPTYDAFSRDASRFSTEQKTPNQQLYYPGDDCLLPSGGSALRVHASLGMSNSPEPPCDVGPTRTAKSHSRRQPPGHIPRPRNAFILYRSWYVKEGFLAEVENDHREISRIVGKIWKQMSSEEQAPWKAMAEEEKVEHARKYPDYKYSPNSRRDAAATSLTNRSAPARLSASRSRKPVSETLVEKRSDAVVGAFVSGSRKLGLLAGVRKIDEQIRAEESEATAETQTLTLTCPTPPSSSSCSSIEPESPASPVYRDIHSTGSTSNANTGGLDVSETLSTIDYEPADDFSLAACSTPFTEFDPDSVRLLPPEQYYRSETFFKTALRPYCNVDAGLGVSTVCDDATDFSSFTFSNDSNLYTSAAPNHQHVASEPELSPFDRIALEGTPAGHPDAISFGTPVWGALFPASSISSTGTSSSLVSDSLSNFSWDQSQEYSSDKEYSASSMSGGDTQPCDYGIFSEWRQSDSPVATDGFDACVLTPTSLSSSVPSPPLSLAYPSPTYPQKYPTLLYHSWETRYDDMDAYERALGDINAEISDHRIF